MKRRDFLAGGAATFGSAILHQNHVYLTATALAGGTAPFRTATLQPAVVSSAGVFDSDGKLVRTLWSAVDNHDNVDNPAAEWDGLIDDLSVAPTGTYTFKVLRHNVSYTWEGVIGNTSPDHYNKLNYHQYAGNICDMAITPAGEMYFTTGYCERWSTMHVTTTANPQVADYVGQYFFRQPYLQNLHCCTDGTYVYFHRLASSSDVWVWAFSCADFSWNTGAIPDKKQTVTFPSSTTGTGTLANSSTGQYITDIDVQRTGSYLFVARLDSTGPDVYNILVFDKTSGADVHTNSLGYALQSVIAANPTNNELWVAHSTGTLHDKVSKLTVDGSGVLTETGVHITGLSDVLGMDISPDGSMLLIADGGTSQQLKALNTSDGASKTAWGTSGTLGIAGGYATSPVVSNDRFMFYADDIGFIPGGGWVAFQADGSFWVGDCGNCRYLHFSSGNSPTYVNRIAYIPSWYATRVCHNDPTRVFAVWLEYSVDYSIPLGIDNGSWTLTYNWAYFKPGPASYGGLRYAGTYSNGRTYAVSFAGSTPKVYELDPATGLRDTGVTIFGFGISFYFDRDFNIWSLNQVGAVGTVYKNDFAGFDGSNNPTWVADQSTSRGAVYLTSATLPADFPEVGWDMNRSFDVGVSLSNGTIPFFDASAGSGTPLDRYHFGGINSSTGEAMFSTHHTTPSNFGGPGLAFLDAPAAPYYGIRCSTSDNGGGPCLYLPGDSYVFTNFIGENWGNNQSNLWSHWHESGLLVQRFGVIAPYFATEHVTHPYYGPNSTETDVANVPVQSNYSFKGFSYLGGNSFQGGQALVDGKYYIYHNDEWYHGGIHRWRVDNVSSVQIASTTVAWDSTSYVAPSVDPYNLLDGLPYNTTNVPNNTAGWVRSPTTDDTTDFFAGPYATVSTNSVTCDPHSVPDLTFLVTCNTGAGFLNASLYSDLTRVGVGNWAIDATLLWNMGDLNNPNRITFIEVLDNTGKVIFKMTNGFQFPIGTSMWVNDTLPFYLTASPIARERWWAYSSQPQPLTINANVGTGKMQATYGDYSITNISVYEVGADITSPSRFRINRVGGSNLPQGVCFTKLLFSEV